MDRADRIAALLIVPMLLLIGYLLYSEDRKTEGASTPQVLGASTERGEGSEGAGDTGTTTGASPDSTQGTDDAGATDPVTTSTTVPSDGPEVATSSLPAADAAAPPQEPRGVYRDGKVVITGSVPQAELADAYAKRAASVLGGDNVTVQMTLDPRVSGESLVIDVDQEFRFPAGEVTFDPEFEALLDLGAAALQLLPETTLVVTGHTDDVGTEGTNLALSQARAQVVVDWMVERGIAPERVVARGAGETAPIADNSTPEGRERNRRIEAVLEGVAPR